MKEKLKALKNKKGFTLIELIVVIAVIGILVLLAAPKFLGYTQDANVSAMEADAKVLSNAALVYNVENDNTWPAGLAYVATGELATVTAGAEFAEVDKAKLSATVKSLKGEYDDYAIVTKDSTDGKVTVGDVVHKAGVAGKDKVKHFGPGLTE